MDKAKLTDDALLAELLRGMWNKVSQIDFILKAGYLPRRAVNGLVDSKLEMIEVTRRLQEALEAEAD